MEDSGLNGSKHCQNSFSSQYHSESHFDLLLPFQNILIMSHFQMICLLSLRHDSALHSGDETATYLVFNTFTSRTTCLLTLIKVCFSLYLCYLPADSYHQHDVSSHFISVSPGFPSGTL
jgi:hypothetical protein